MNDDRMLRWVERLYTLIMGTSDIDRRFPRIWGRGFYTGVAFGAAWGALMMWLVMS